jgi:chromosome segregation ATPase
MSDYKEQFDKLQEEINNKKLEKAKLEERLENLTKERTEIFNELKTLDIATPEDLKIEIGKLEKEINEELEKCQKSLK